MNLAELIINTIKDEAIKTRQHMSAVKDEIIKSIETSDSRTFLEKEVGEAVNISGLSFVSEPILKKINPWPILKKINPCQREIASRKCPNASFDERDIDDWVRANFYKCTKIIELSRKNMTAMEIARTLDDGKPERVHSQANIYQIKSALKKYGYTSGETSSVCATDKLRELRP